MTSARVRNVVIAVALCVGLANAATLLAFTIEHGRLPMGAEYINHVLGLGQ